ncbi:MAG: hypothetical protein O2787_07380 [Cyanobacteria bacterium]|nr:hypothetical protein [Cyanobacteriota bacterium]
MPNSKILSGEEALALERLSRRQGSGLTAVQLFGHWRLQLLWSKGRANPNPATAALLRGLQASLSITTRGDNPIATADAPSLETGDLKVVNSVQLGALQLRFSGSGNLRGRRPLLEFWFDQLELRLGRQTLWRQAISRQPEPRRRPFFALIARSGSADNDWLLARGRGGGLALWLLDPQLAKASDA